MAFGCLNEYVGKFYAFSSYPKRNGGFYSYRVVRKDDARVRIFLLSLTRGVGVEILYIKKYKTE